MRRNISGHHCTGGDDRPIADRDPLQDQGTGADPHVFANADVLRYLMIIVQYPVGIVIPDDHIRRDDAPFAYGDALRADDLHAVITETIVQDQYGIVQHADIRSFVDNKGPVDYHPGILADPKPRFECRFLEVLPSQRKRPVEDQLRAAIQHNAAMSPWNKHLVVTHVCTRVAPKEVDTNELRPGRGRKPHVPPDAAKYVKDFLGLLRKPHGRLPYTAGPRGEHAAASILGCRKPFSSLPR